MFHSTIQYLSIHGSRAVKPEPKAVAKATFDDWNWIRDRLASSVISCFLPVSECSTNVPDLLVSNHELIDRLPFTRAFHVSHSTSI